MLEYIKKSTKATVVILISSFIALFANACVSSDSEVFYGERCIKEDAVYEFAKELSNGDMDYDSERIIEHDVSESDVLAQFSEYISPLCLEQTENLFATSRYYKGDLKNNELNLTTVSDDIDRACDLSYTDSTYSQRQEFSVNHLMLTYMSAVTYMSGGPLFQSIECEDVELSINYNDRSIPIQLQYHKLALNGSESGLKSRL